MQAYILVPWLVVFLLLRAGILVSLARWCQGNSCPQLQWALRDSEYKPTPTFTNNNNYWCKLNLRANM
jgi:hypothetical protein